MNGNRRTASRELSAEQLTAARHCAETVLPAVPFFLDKLVQHIDSSYRTLTDRRHRAISGLSMGGFGTWDLAMAFPGRFAAIAPICGGGNARNVCVIKDLPIWNFHGAKDTVVPLDISIGFADLPELAQLAQRWITGGSVGYSLEGTIGVDAGPLGDPTFGPMRLLSGSLEVRR